MSNPPVPPAQSPWPADPRPGPMAGLIYAGFGVRLGALIIDLIVVGIINSAISGVLGLGPRGFYGVDWTHPDFWQFGFFAPSWFASVVVQAIVSGAYFVYGWTHWSATFGQRILNLRVLMNADGSMLAQDVAIKRWALVTVPIVGSLPPFGFLVFLYQLYLAYSTYQDPAKRGFHDYQTGTVVVQAV